MKHRKWIGIVIAIAGMIAMFILFFPLATDNEETSTGREQISLAPDFEQTVAIEPGTLVLPTVAGAPATIHFDATNVGEKNAVYIRAVSIEHTDHATMFTPRGADIRRLSNVPIHPGETVTFGSATNQLVLSDYDSSVVPGTSLRMRIGLSNGQVVDVPLTVESRLEDASTNREPQPESSVKPDA